VRCEVNFIFDPSLVLYLPLCELDGSSFMSRDAYGHLCTVTGALWRPDGHFFDGSDDDVNLGDVSVLNIGAADDISIIAWIHLDTVASSVIITKHLSYAVQGWDFRVRSGGKLGFNIRDAAGDNFDLNSLTALLTGQWYHVAGTINRDTLGNCKCYINGQGDTGTPGGTLADVGDTTNAADVVLAKWTASVFHGTIGEVIVYKRVLTPLEIHHNYLATKWRYK